MTTEEQLRAALASLVMDYSGVEDMMDAATDAKIDAARAALALPVSESRVEWRVAYEVQLGSEWVPRSLEEPTREEAEETANAKRQSQYRRNIRIESRTVTTSEWKEDKV